MKNPTQTQNPTQIIDYLAFPCYCCFCQGEGTKAVSITRLVIKSDIVRSSGGKQ